MSLYSSRISWFYHVVPNQICHFQDFDADLIQTLFTLSSISEIIKNIEVVALAICMSRSESVSFSNASFLYLILSFVGWIGKILAHAACQTKQAQVIYWLNGAKWTLQTILSVRPDVCLHPSVWQLYRQPISLLLYPISFYQFINLPISTYIQGVH